MPETVYMTLDSDRSSSSSSSSLLLVDAFIQGSRELLPRETNSMNKTGYISTRHRASFSAGNWELPVCPLANKLLQVLIM